MKGLELLLDLKLEMPLTVDHARSFLEQCPPAIGMHAVTEPFADSYPGGQIMGAIIIAESNICLYAQGLACFVDVNSCRLFDWEQTRAFALERLGAELIQHHLIERQIGAQTDFILSSLG